MKTLDEKGATPCYTAACPICGRVIAVATAPVDEPEIMRHAIRDRAQWERSGLTMGMCVVSEVWAGIVALGHADDCQRAKHKRRRSANNTGGGSLELFR